MPNDRKSYSEEKFISYAFGFKGISNLNAVTQLLTLLVEHELFRLNTWHSPIGREKDFTVDKKVNWNVMVKTAWSANPKVAIFLPDRFVAFRDVIKKELVPCIRTNPIAVCDCEAAQKILEEFGSEKDLRVSSYSFLRIECTSLGCIESYYKHLIIVKRWS
jgi:hypothetical protein